MNESLKEQLAALLFSSTRDLIWVGLAPLALLLAIAAWFDLRWRRIPNGLVVSGVLLALVLHGVLPEGDGFASQLPGGLGLLASLEGLGICLALLFPCYALRALGAGDVKLTAMVGAFLGPGQIWGALLSIALTGGLLALAVGLRRRVLGQMLSNIGAVFTGGLLQVAGGSLPRLDLLHTAARLPYGVAIALGTGAYLVFALYRAGLI